MADGAAVPIEKLDAVRAAGLVRQLPRSVFTHGIASAGLLAVHVAGGVTAFGLMWGLVAFGVAALRIAIKPSPGIGEAPRADIQKALRNAEWQSVLSGLVWGSVPYLFAAGAEPQAKLPLMLLVAGMVVGNFSIFNQSPRIVAGYTIPAFVMILIYVQVFSMEYTMLLSGMLALLGFVLILGSLNSARVLADAVSMVERGARAETRLSAAINTGQDAYAFFDGSGEIVESNPAFRKQFPNTFKLNDLPQETTIHQPTDDQWFLMDAQLIASGETVVRLSNVTAIKRAELAESEARTKIEAADIQKTAFMRSVSHELRTPLHLIMGYTDLIDGQKATPGEVSTYVAEIRGGSARLLRLVNRIIRFVDLQEKSSAKPQKTMSLGDDFEKWMKRRFDGEIGFKTSPSTNDVTLTTDWNSFGEALDELVCNARNHGGDPADLFISTSQNEERAQISVLDRGPGMSDFFARAEHKGPLKVDFVKKHDGLGMGIALTVAILDDIGGELTFEERPEGGTKAMISLPINT